MSLARQREDYFFRRSGRPKTTKAKGSKILKSVRLPSTPASRPLRPAKKSARLSDQDRPAAAPGRDWVRNSASFVWSRFRKEVGQGFGQGEQGRRRGEGFGVKEHQDAAGQGCGLYRLDARNGFQARLNDRPQRRVSLQRRDLEPDAPGDGMYNADIAVCHAASAFRAHGRPRRPRPRHCARLWPRHRGR